MKPSDEIVKWARAAVDVLGDLRRPLAGRVDAAHEILREALADHDAAVGSGNDPKKDEIATRAAQECARYRHGQQTRPEIDVFTTVITQALSDYEALRRGEGEK